MRDWYRAIAAESQLSADESRQLRENGFTVLPGAVDAADLARLGLAYDRAILTAASGEVRVKSSIRLHDLVNRGSEFDGLYVSSPVLAACCQVIQGPFKLSSLMARTLEPGALAPALHVDVRRGADGWPLVGFIVMIDEFRADNGATRFVSGSHLWSHEPDSLTEVVREELACGQAGSMILFNGSVWHGWSANRSSGCRRSVQGAFIPREAQAATDWASRMRPETLNRLSGVAKYLLTVGPTSERGAVPEAE